MLMLTTIVLASASAVPLQHLPILGGATFGAYPRARVA
jgi:hypothetical protein